MLARCDFHRRNVAPEILEPVVRPCLRCEDVQDDIEVVRDDPGRVALSVDRPGKEAYLVLHPRMDLVVDRSRLPRVLPRTDDEEVRVAARGPHVENDDVLRELVLCEAGDAARLFD